MLPRRINWPTFLLFIMFIAILILNIWSFFYVRSHRDDFYPNVRTSSDSGYLFVSAHDQVYENSWIIKIDPAVKSAKVQIIDTGMKIEFKAKNELFYLLEGRLNWILPVTFYCNGKPDRNCDLEKPFVLYAGMRLVEPVTIEKTKKNGEN